MKKAPGSEITTRTKRKFSPPVNVRFVEIDEVFRKWKALTELLAQRGIQPTQDIPFGDRWEDIQGGIQMIQMQIEAEMSKAIEDLTKLAIVGFREREARKYGGK
jgi:hypothetical protein